MKKNAFTLIEVILVVTILGILGALVLPTFQGHIVTARESTAKDSLRTMRTQIEMYKLRHDGVQPGYADEVPASTEVLRLQFVGTTYETGAASYSKVPSAAYPCGPYIRKLPKNPYNNLSTIIYVVEATAFSDAVDGTSSGWLYKKETAEFKVNWVGSDSEGANFYDY